MDFHNKKVLALPVGEYYDLFNKIFTVGKNGWSWNICCVATSNYLKPYRNFIDSKKQLCVVPDFLKKQEWESDEEKVKEIRKIMAASEKMARVPLNRIILSCERDIGRAYSKTTYYWPELDITRAILKNEQKSEAILARAFKFAVDTLQKFKPDFCLGAPASGLVNGVFYFVAKYYGIPSISPIFSMAIPDRHFWTREWGAFNQETLGALQKKTHPDYQPSKASFDYINAFRKEPEPLPFYQKTWADKRNQVTFLNVTNQVIKRFIYRIVPILKGVKVSNPKPFFQTTLNLYRGYFLKKLQKKFYVSFSDNELKNFKYVYYPVHQDPEFVLNVQGSFWYNQLNTIRMLSYNLPAGYKLLVREHRHNVGRRSNRYLKEIGRYPGVVIVDAFDDQYKYIKNSDLVVTVNGSSGLEGILLKKNVLTLDRTSYDALDLAFKIKNKTEFGALLLEAVENDRFRDDYDNRLASFFDAEREISFSVDEDPEVEMRYIQDIINRENIGNKDELP